MTQFPQGPQDPVLRPRDLGQVLDHTFKVFTRSWKPLIAVGLLGALPTILLAMLSFFLFAGDIESGPMGNWFLRMILSAEMGDFSGILAFFGVILLFSLVILLLIPLYNGAVIDVATRAALHMEPVPLTESLGVGARRYWALLGNAVIQFFLYLIAFPVLVLGGLVIFFFITLPLGYAALHALTMFANHAVVVEGKGGGFTALGRAWELGKSRFWPLVGFVVVFYLMVYVIQMMISLPLSFATGFAVAATESLQFMPLIYVGQGLVQAIAIPLLVLGKTVVYFDTRVRREAFDLEVMARQQGSPPHPHQ